MSERIESLLDFSKGSFMIRSVCQPQFLLVKAYSVCVYEAFTILCTELRT